MRLRRERCPKRVCTCICGWPQTHSAACTVCLWSARSYENIRPMHTLLWWFIADTSGGEDVQETVGTEGIRLGQLNINIPFKMPRTSLHGTHSQWHILKSRCWHGACTWPSFIAPVCPLWRSVLCACVCVCVWRFCVNSWGRRLQAPEPRHLISPGWPWSLQSWGNTVHKEPLIWTGPLYIVLLIKHHRDSLTVFQKSQPYFR